MTAPVTGVQRRLRGVRGWDQVVVAVLAGLVVAVTVVVLVRPSAVGLRVDGAQLGRLAAAAVVYLASHAVRALRLALLVHRPGIRFRQVLQVHLFTASLGVLIPFKLSELVRVREVAALRGSWRTGLLVVWLERGLDAAVLTVLLGLALAGGGDALEQLVPALAVVAGFAVLSFLLVSVVPGNVRGLMLYLVRRPSRGSGLAVMRACRVVLVTLAQVPRLVAGKLATLLLLSLLVWAFELLALSVAFGLALNPSQLSSGVLAVVSTVSIGVTAIMAGTEGRLLDVLGAAVGADASAGADLYRAVLVVPLLVLGTLAVTRLVGRRRRRRA